MDSFNEFITEIKFSRRSPNWCPFKYMLNSDFVLLITHVLTTSNKDERFERIRTQPMKQTETVTVSGLFDCNCDWIFQTARCTKSIMYAIYRHKFKTVRDNKSKTKKSGEHELERDMSLHPLQFMFKAI